METQFQVGQIAMVNGVRMRYAGGGRWVLAADEQQLAKRFDPASEAPLHKVRPCT